MKQITKYAATDGTEFETAEHCREYEDQQAVEVLAGCVPSDIIDGVEGRNRPVRKAIQRLYGLIQAARYEAGEVRPRGSKKAVQAVPTVAKEPRKARAA